MRFKSLKRKKCDCGRETDRIDEFCCYCGRELRAANDRGTEADQNGEVYEEVLSNIASDLFEGGCCGTNF